MSVSAKSVLQSLAIFVLTFVFPVGASAFNANPTPELKKIDLVLLVNSVPVKGALSLEKGAKIVITWSSAGKGCLNNWDGSITASDPVGSEGILNESRSLVITCYGLGIAQTLKVRLNVVSPDLIVSNLIIDAIEPVTAAGKIKPNTFKAKDVGAYTLHATIKNAGLLDVKKPFKVKFSAGLKDASGKINFAEMESKTIQSLAKGAVVTVDLPRAATAQKTNAYYFQAIVDSDNVIDEGTKETNNASKTLGGSSGLIFE